MTTRYLALSWLLIPALTAFALTGCGSTDGNPKAAPATDVATRGENSPGENSATPPVQIGATQEVVYADVTTSVTVEDLTPAQPSKYGIPADGDLQQITATLEGVDGTTDVNPLYFTARAADGTSYDAALGTVDDQLSTATLTAGDILKGVVAFDVTGPPIASIRYNGALGNELAKWVGQSSRSSSSATAAPPPAGSVRGDLDLPSTTISAPSCDGTGIVVLYSATNPSTYKEEIAAQLSANPGASYLRTDNVCPSLRQATAEGNAIYAVCRTAGRTETEVCTAVTASSGDAYGKWLDTTTDPGYIIPC